MSSTKKRKFMPRELMPNIDPNRPIPHDEIEEAEQGRIGADRTDYILVVKGKSKKKNEKMSSSSPYKPLGHKRNCQCSQCKLCRKWQKEKMENP